MSPRSTCNPAAATAAIATRTISSASSSYRYAHERQDEIPRGTLAAIHKAQVVKMRTRNGLGSAVSKSNRDICTDPEGSCRMCERGALDLPSESHETAAGVRSDLKMVEPLGLHTNIASKRSSAASFCKIGA